MVMRSLVVVKYVHENCVVSDPATSSERFRKHLVAHCCIIDADYIVYIDFVFLNLLFSSCYFSKCSQKPFSIIIIYSSKF